MKSPTLQVTPGRSPDFAALERPFVTPALLAARCAPSYCTAPARDFAAAPDLLAALEKVAHCSRYLPSQGDEMLHALEHLREIARAAIAKAQGGAQ